MASPTAPCLRRAPTLGYRRDANEGAPRADTRRGRLYTRQDYLTGAVRIVPEPGKSFAALHRSSIHTGGSNGGSEEDGARTQAGLGPGGRRAGLLARRIKKDGAVSGRGEEGGQEGRKQPQARSRSGPAAEAEVEKEPGFGPSVSALREIDGKFGEIAKGAARGGHNKPAVRVRLTYFRP
jgi:hypothetical protein